jgi:hypothetical protein
MSQQSLQILAGITSKRVFVFISDALGNGVTGLTHSSSGLICYRARDDDGNTGATQLPLVAGTRGIWSSGGFVEKDSSFEVGVYELGLDNAGLATGSSQVKYMLSGASTMVPAILDLQLVTVSGESNVFSSGTATGGTLNTITLPHSENTVPGIYIGNLIKITGGTGYGQCRTIINYTGEEFPFTGTGTDTITGTGTGSFLDDIVTIDRPWIVIPDNTSQYAILAADNPTLDSSLRGQLAANGVDAITIESGLNLRQATSIVASSYGGVLEGAPTQTILIHACNNPGIIRIVAATDRFGNRESVTLNIPA